MLLILAALHALADPRLPYDLNGPLSLPDDPELLHELQRSIKEHDEHHQALCKRFYCGPVGAVDPMEYDVYPVGMPSVDVRYAPAHLPTCAIVRESGGSGIEASARELIEASAWTLIAAEQ